MFRKLLLTTFVIQYITLNILLHMWCAYVSAIWIVLLTFTSPCTCYLTAKCYELTVNLRYFWKGCSKRNIIMLFSTHPSQLDFGGLAKELMLDPKHILLDMQHACNTAILLLLYGEYYLQLLTPWRIVVSSHKFYLQQDNKRLYNIKYLHGKSDRRGQQTSV